MTKIVYFFKKEKIKLQIENQWKTDITIYPITYIYIL